MTHVSTYCAVKGNIKKSLLSRDANYRSWNSHCQQWMNWRLKYSVLSKFRLKNQIYLKTKKMAELDKFFEAPANMFSFSKKEFSLSEVWRQPNTRRRGSEDLVVAQTYRKQPLMWFWLDGNVCMFTSKTSIFL